MSCLCNKIKSLLNECVGYEDEDNQRLERNYFTSPAPKMPLFLPERSKAKPPFARLRKAENSSQLMTLDTAASCLAVDS